MSEAYFFPRKKEEKVTTKPNPEPPGEGLHCAKCGKIIERSLISGSGYKHHVCEPESGAVAPQVEAKNLAECWPVGVFIQEELEARNWSAKDLALRMGGKSAIEVGRDQLCVEMLVAVAAARLDEETAQKMAKAFDVSPELFTNLDRTYHEWQAQQASTLKSRPEPSPSVGARERWEALKKRICERLDFNEQHCSGVNVQGYQNVLNDMREIEKAAALAPTQPTNGEELARRIAKVFARINSGDIGMRIHVKNRAEIRKEIADAEQALASLSAADQKEKK